MANSKTLTATYGVNIIITETSPSVWLKPNHITARNTIRMVGIDQHQWNDGEQRAFQHAAQLDRQNDADAGEHIRAGEGHEDARQLERDDEIGLYAVRRRARRNPRRIVSAIVSGLLQDVGIVHIKLQAIAESLIRTRSSS